MNIYIRGLNSHIDQNSIVLQHEWMKRLITVAPTLRNLSHYNNTERVFVNENPLQNSTQHPHLFLDGLSQLHSVLTKDLPTIDSTEKQ